MTDKLLIQYTKLYQEVLVPVSQNLGPLISNHLNDAERVDRITARAKDPMRFIEKARSVNKKGVKYYSKPLIQIQDQIGARVVVFYKEGMSTLLASF